MKKFLMNYAPLLVTLLCSCASLPGESGAQETSRAAQLTNPVQMPPDADKVSPQLLTADCRLNNTDYEMRRQCYRVVAAQLPPIDPNRREHFDESYDPAKFVACVFKANNTYELDASVYSCDRFRLRRIENPEYWPNPDIPKLKWPEPPNPPTYRPGMSSEAYFNALCEKEAGEFIYRTVENVEGIYQIRPRNRADDDNQRMQDRYVIEDPYTYTQGGRRRT